MMHPERDGLPPPGETYARGTPNMWTTASGDEQFGLVYLPMGNAAADYWSGLRRPQENEYRSEEHTSELQSLMRISYAVFCLKKKKTKTQAKNSTAQITPQRQL